MVRPDSGGGPVYGAAVAAVLAPRDAPARLSAAESGRLTALATTASVLTALALTALKAVAWRWSGSTSLLASTADSALDLLAALGAFWAVRYAVAPPDAEHRFGHGKAEAFASLLQAGLVIASAALIGREAVGHVLHPTPVRAEGIGVAVVAVSIAATVGLLTLQGWVVRRTRSVAVAGDRAHYAADLLSNVAALAGLALARLTGDARWDALAGLVVAVWLVWGALWACSAPPAARSWTASWRRPSASRSSTSHAPTTASWASIRCAPAPPAPSSTCRCTWTWRPTRRWWRRTG